jgi:hypothetical protein
MQKENVLKGLSESNDMKIWAIALGMLALVVLLGCASVPPAGSSAYFIGDEISLKPGESAYITSEKLLIGFVNVTEDSRCPKDVQCIWQGRIVALFSVKRDGKDLGEFSLASIVGGKFDEKEIDGKYFVRLGRVDANNRAVGEKSVPSDYTAHIVVYSTG